MIAPSQSEILWDKLIFTKDGTLSVSPGVVKLSGNDLKIGWDIQNATGSAGATTKRTKEPIKEFDAEFYIVDEVGTAGATEFDEWDLFQALLESTVPANGKPYALDVYHPDLARNHITAVTLGSISGMQLDGKGGARVKVHFLEYRPPKPITSSNSTATKTEGDKAIDADVAKIKELQDEYQHL